MNEIQAPNWTDRHTGGVSDSIGRRQVDVLCLELCRLACQADSSDRLVTFAVDQIVRTLGMTAAGVWMYEPGERVWRLAAASGVIADRAVRAALVSVPAAGPHGNPFCPAGIAAEVTRRWHGTAPLTAPADSLSDAAAILQSACETSGVLIIWSIAADESELRAIADSIARDLSRCLDSIRRNTSQVELARFGSTVFDFAPLAIVGIDIRHCCTRWSPAAQELFGWPESEVLDLPVRIVPGHKGHEFWSVFERCVRTSALQQTCFVGQRWDGSELQLRARLVPLARRGHEPTEVMLMISDETGHDSVRRFLQIEREVSSLLSLATSAEAAGHSVLRTVCTALAWPAGEVWQVSPDGLHWCRTAAWAREPSAADHESDQQAVQMPIDCGLPGRVRLEQQVVTAPGQRNHPPRQAPGSLPSAQDQDAIAIPVTVRHEVQAVLVFYGDFTKPHELPLHRLLTSVADKLAHLVGRDKMTAALAKAEESLRQTQKMEAIGLLAGGIAHDFNNLLTVILGNCELLLGGRVAEDRTRESLQEIRAAGEQGASLTRQLLTFSRKRPRELKVLYPGQVLDEMLRMLQRVAGEHVVIETRLAHDTHPVRMDRIEFEQVMLNLTANARDAMPAGGTLTIAVSNAFLGLKEVSAYPEVRPGDFAVLTVADTGCGMDEATQARAFEPFFTTKNVERGTGLGLATVYGIVRGCGGIVELESTPGAGTRFTMFLPRAAIGIKPRRSDERLAPDPRGSETVVVVEDEDVLRSLVQRILEVHGYRVHACSSGFDALNLLKESAHDVGLLLADVVMPRMSGPELVREARLLRPDLPAVLMSGYRSPSDLPGSEIEAGPELLHKPFTSEALTRAVRRTLDSAAIRRSSATGCASLPS